MSCAHASWRPLPGWVGRYRCDACGVLAHRGILTSDIRSHSESSMLVYACTRKGCGAGAVSRKPQLCSTHYAAHQARARR